MKAIVLSLTFTLSPIFGQGIFNERVWTSFDDKTLTGELVSFDGKNVTIKQKGKPRVKFDVNLLSQEDTTAITEEKQRIETLIQNKLFDMKILKEEDLIAAYKFGLHKELLLSAAHGENFLKIGVQSIEENTAKSAIIRGEGIAISLELTCKIDEFFRRGRSLYNRHGNRKLYTEREDAYFRVIDIVGHLMDVKEGRIGVDDIPVIFCKDGNPSGPWGLIKNQP